MTYGRHYAYSMWKMNLSILSHTTRATGHSNGDFILGFGQNDTTSFWHNTSDQPPRNPMWTDSYDKPPQVNAKEEEFRDLHIILSSLFFVIGILFNVATIILIFKSPDYQHLKKDVIFVINLLINNILLCVFLILPMIINAAFLYPNEQNTDTLIIICKFVLYFQSALIGAEYIALVLISINRYFLIVRYPWYQKLFMKNRNTKFLFLINWLICPILFIPLFSQGRSSVSYNMYTSLCFLDDEESTELYVTIFIFVLMFPVLICCYISIVRKTCKVRRKVNIARKKSAVSRQIGDNNHNTSLEMKLVVVVVFLLTKMAISYLPYLFWSLATFQLSNKNPYINVALLYIRLSNCFTNALVYICFNGKMRNYILNCLPFSNKDAEEEGESVNNTDDRSENNDGSSKTNRNTTKDSDGNSKESEKFQSMCKVTFNENNLQIVYECTDPRSDNPEIVQPVQNNSRSNSLDKVPVNIPPKKELRRYLSDGDKIDGISVMHFARHLGHTHSLQKLRERSHKYKRKSVSRSSLSEVQENLQNSSGTASRSGCEDGEQKSDDKNEGNLSIIFSSKYRLDGIKTIENYYTTAEDEV